MRYFFRAFILALLFLPQVTHAAGEAELFFAEESYSFTRGEHVDVIVEIAANQSSLDTVRAVLTYDPNVLMAQDAHLLGVFDRSAPGNYIDNTSGKVSWGAFTLEESLTTSTSFVAVTFLALEAGETTIAISPDSRAISLGEEQLNLQRLDSTEVEVTLRETDSATATLLSLESSTHPSELQWYPSTEVNLSWTPLQGSSEIVSYTYVLDEDPQASLAQVVDALTQEISVDVGEDGVYVFRIQGTQADGQTTPIAERVVRVDTTSPNPIELAAQDTQLLEGESAWFSFATTDETSGVLQYQIAINDDAFELQTSPLEVKGLPVGTYFVRVAALDRAGNTTYGSSSIRVYPSDTDLERPEGYEDHTEIQAIGPATIIEIDPPTSPNKFLWGLGGVTLFLLLFFMIRSQRRRREYS